MDLHVKLRPYHVSVCIISLILWISVSAVGALEVGDQAPDFKLPSTTGEEISLSDFKDKKHVLIQFYTLDFNPT